MTDTAWAVLVLLLDAPTDDEASELLAGADVGAGDENCDVEADDETCNEEADDELCDGEGDDEL